MTDVLSLTEEEILAIPLDMPERVFTGDMDAARLQMRKLRSKWQPRTSDTSAAMAHINALYDRATELIQKGLWRRIGSLVIKATSGKEYLFRYLKAEPFELGITYIGEAFVVYFVKDDYADLVRIAQDHIERSFVFPDGKLKAEHERSLPKLQTLIQAKNGYYLVIKKDPEYLRLSDVLEHFGGKIDPKHVAWMLSRLYNLSCFLQLSNLVHHDISPQNCFINPKQHYLALLGGWWYARKCGEKLIALPQRTITYGPTSLMSAKLAVPSTNSELIKATGRDLLGDSVGSRLATMGHPSALVNWLRFPAKEEAAWEEYAYWERVLKNSFGARKFIELKLESKDIYTR